MNNYRRLSPKDAKKIKVANKFRKILKITAKSSFVLCVILIFLIAGVFFFYNVVDNQNAEGCEGCTEESKAVSSEAESDFVENKEEEYDVENDKKEADLTESEKRELDIDKNKTKDESNDSEKKEIIENEENCNYDFSKWNKVCPRELIVVNKFNMVPDEYKVNTKLCRGKEVDDDVCEHLEQMIVDARKDDIILWISSGYRSVELQSKLFYNQVEREKNKGLISDEEAKKRAQTVVAFPKTSEHNTGLAVDFNGVQDDFCTKKEYKWLVENAHKYGFIERYQQGWQDKTGVIYEPWHFRYVGVENSLLIKESGISLEEYVFKNLAKDL